MSPLDRCGLGVAEGEQGDVGRQELAGLAWAFFSFFALRFSFNVLAACFLSVLLASCPLGMNLLFVLARCAGPGSLPRQRVPQPGRYGQCDLGGRRHRSPALPRRSIGAAR